MTAKNKKSFLVHIDSLSVLDDLTDEQAGQLLKAISAYQKGEEINLNPIVKIAFSPFKNQFMRDNEKYEKTCEIRAKAGALGGKAKAEKEKQDLANASKSQQNLANVAENKNKNKSKTNNKSELISNLPTDGKPPASKKFNDEDIRFAEWFYQGLLNNNPQHKKPNFESSGWADAVRLMRERDGRTYDQMADLAKWTLNDSFWKANVLSPAKLRDQWDRLILRKEQPHSQQKAKWDNTENLASELTNMFEQKEIYNE